MAKMSSSTWFFSIKTKVLGSVKVSCGDGIELEIDLCECSEIKCHIQIIQIYIYVYMRRRIHT